MAAGFRLDVSAYLKRIEYRGSYQPILKTLGGLLLAHLQRVPFKNLSIHWGKEVLLNPINLLIRSSAGGGVVFVMN